MSRDPQLRGGGIAWAFVLVALLSAWPFASVEPYWWGIAVIALGALGALFAARVEAPRVRCVLGSNALLLAAALPGVALLQALPLPAVIAGLANPTGMALLDEVTAGLPPAWRAVSLDPLATLDAAALAVGVALVALCVAVRQAGSTRREMIPWLIVLGGVGLAVFGLAQRLVDPSPQRMFWSVEIYEVGTPFGPYVNRNHFGGAMLLFAGVAAGLATDLAARRRRALGALATGALVVLLVALLATTSRGALLGAAAGALVFALLRRGDVRRRGSWVPALSLLVVVALGLYATGLLGDLVGRLDEHQGRWANRFAVQLDALRVFLRHPLTGTGAGTFPTVYSAFQTADGSRYFRDAHSDWAQFLMETGALGVAFVALLAVRLRRAAHFVRRASIPEAWIVRGALAGLAGLAVHGLFETNLHIPANALLAGAVTGIAFGGATGLPTAGSRSSGAPLDDDESPSPADAPSGDAPRT